MNLIRRLFRKKPKVNLEERAINRDFFEDLELLTGEHFGVFEKAYVRKYLREHLQGRDIPEDSYSFICKKSAVGYLSELGYDFKNGDGRIDRWKTIEDTIIKNQMRRYEESKKN
jgi:hypothetical protein